MVLRSRVNELFSQSRSAAGSRSIMFMMREDGIEIGRFKVRKLKVLNCRGIGAQLGDTVANGANSSSYECELSSVTLENPRNFVANAGSIGVMVYATDSYISRVVPVGYETGLRDQGGRTITTWCTSGRTPRTAR